MRDQELRVTGDWNTTFEHRLLYISCEAVTIILNPEPYFYKENPFYDKSKRL